MGDKADKSRLNHGHETLQLLDRGGIEPTPENYETVYRFVTGSDPRVADAVRDVLNRQQHLDSKSLARIRRTESANDLEEVLTQVLQASSDQMDALVQQVGFAHQSAQAFGETLELGEENLRLSKDPEVQAMLVNQLTAATAAMLEKTRRLEHRLAQSTAEMTILKDELNKARSESRTDGLTGLPNRKALQSYLSAQTARSIVDKKMMTLIFADIDFFKKINDTWGHHIGDEVLRLVGQALEQQCATIGYAARYGGEEFVVVLPNKDLQAAVDIGEQFRDYISSRTVKVRRSQFTIGQITLSLGVAQLGWDDSADDLLERADAALYLAKQSGRNRVCTERDLPSARSGMRVA